ncbi:MAG: VanZ family protein [Clostridia bacterium]|nr:VanZ family protein [Clostridia bacterium]
MNKIIEYAINMLPYMLLAVPIYAAARFIYIKARRRKTDWRREMLLFCFALFCAGLASQTVIPKFEFGIGGFGIANTGIHQTNLIPFKVFYETFNEVFYTGNINYFLINFLGNIILFVPFGIFLPLLWNISYAKAVGITFCISLFIETAQLFLPRGTDVDDLILNTLGALLGVFVYMLMKKILKRFVFKIKQTDTNAV